MEETLKIYAYRVQCVILVQKESGSPELPVEPLKNLKTTSVISLDTAFTITITTGFYPLIKCHIKV